MHTENEMIPLIQDRLFDDRDLRPEITRNKDLVKSVSTETSQVLRWIHELYLPHGIDLDCTYRVGSIYSGTELRPRIKSDINPRGRDTLSADFMRLPFKDNSMRSVMFDPPFFASSGGGRGTLGNKYGFYMTINDLWSAYRIGLAEIYRVLKLYGVLVMKCQDFVYGRRQYIIHADIINYAQNINLSVRDIFIRVSDHVSISPNQVNQIHARKFHCYYIVFKKLREIQNILPTEPLKS
jgi:hypothetical protein